MGREVRMVPPDWQHPTEWEKDRRTGQPKLRHRPLFDGNYAKAAAEWDEEKAAWDRGEMRDWSSGGWCPKDEAALECASFEEWHGERPREEDYMPDFAPGTATHLMMYETTSEGTPISPAFATPEELARWLADNNASAFGSDGATYGEWLGMIRHGWAPSMVIQGGRMQSGVAAMTKVESQAGAHSHDG